MSVRYIDDDHVPPRRDWSNAAVQGIGRVCQVCGCTLGERRSAYCASCYEEQRSMENRHRPQLDRPRTSGAPLAALLDAIGDVPEWQLDAACRGLDTDMFFPERGEPVEQARNVCRSCTVANACATFSLANGEKWGLWGAMSEADRRRVRKVWARQRSST
jgi:WhiB family redox-sensing transcriptional regulator